MITDQQYKELCKKYEELNSKYTQMSQNIVKIMMTLDLKESSKTSNQPQSRKDITRYSFMGKLFNKRQLVLKCIKQYIKDTKVTDASVLLELFPDYIQGSLGVIRAAEKAERYSDAKERYFFNDDQVLQLNEDVYVVSKDWTVKNIDRFIDVMNTLGYEIKPIIRN